MRLRMVLTAFVVLGLASTASLWGAVDHMKRPGPAHGRLHLVSSKRGAILSGRNLAPGDRVDGSVTIRNTGRLAGAFTLRAKLRGSKQLADYLALSVRERTRRTTRLVYSGRLARFRTLKLGAIGPGRARTFRFSVSFRPDAPNRLQRQRSTATFIWRAVQPS
jgi:spore coat-associated protein N